LSASALESLSVIEKETVLRKKLWDNIRSIYTGLSEAGFVLGRPESAILPVMMGSEKCAVEAFQTILREGIFIPAIRYPTVAKGKARLRITVSASHTQCDIRALLKAFKSYMGKRRLKKK
jgi:8-amino-7-oxononanoate synthase